MGIFSLWTIFNFFVTIFVLIVYALGYIKRAVTNYWSKRLLSMETLIALGSSGAFILFLFFLIEYSFFSTQKVNTLQERAKMVQTINSALTSSAIIVVVVTIGKYF